AGRDSAAGVPAAAVVAAGAIGIDHGRRVVSAVVAAMVVVGTAVIVIAVGAGRRPRAMTAAGGAAAIAGRVPRSVAAARRAAAITGGAPRTVAARRGAAAPAVRRPRGAIAAPAAGMEVGSSRGERRCDRDGSQKKQLPVHRVLLSHLLFHLPF